MVDDSIDNPLIDIFLMIYQINYDTNIISFLVDFVVYTSKIYS